MRDSLGSTTSWERDIPIFCIACETLRAQQYGPEPLGQCPKCGTEGTVWYPAGKEFDLRIGRMRNRSIPKGTRRWEYQSEARHSEFRLSGRIHFVEREINRLTNEYHERIIDKLTGQVVREVHEPLTQHQGRGAAKRRRKPPS